MIAMVAEIIRNEDKVSGPSGRVASEQRTMQSSQEFNFVRHKLEDFQATVLKDVEHRMSCMIDEVMQELRQHELQAYEFRNFNKTQKQQIDTWNNRVDNSKRAPSSEVDAHVNSAICAEDKASAIADESHAKQKRALPDKVFVTRESYLTALLEVDHMKTIYHIFNIILFILLLNSMCYDYFVEGRITFGLNTFKTGFEKIEYVLCIWLLEHAFVFALYYAFKGWANVRAQLPSQRPLQRFWTHSCLIVYVASQLMFGYVASALCLRLNLPFVTACVLLLESTRLLMKMHAFVRTNAGRIVARKLKTDDDDGADITSYSRSTGSVPVTPFSSYLYFLFAPTLIYRDSYPRTSQIRWRFAASRFMEVVAVAFLYSYLHERHIKVHFSNYGREELNANALIVKFFGMLMPGVIILLSGFYLILHSWLNFTSELLRFGDRMFYKDWWTVSTYDAYYRNWNVVVHDFLYEYIYKDFYNYIFKGSKLAASLMVFMVSALVHDHILSFALQLFFPVMFVFFGVLGVLFVFMTRNAPKNSGNLFVWFSLIVGNGLMISLYCMEYYARVNCSLVRNNWFDYMIPVAWSCYHS